MASARTAITLVLEEKRHKERQLENDIYREIEQIFQHQLYKPNETGEEDGISDEFILRKIFGKRSYTKEEISLIKKLRQRYQLTNRGLVGSRNSSGEYIRYYPKDEIEVDRYITTRRSSILGQVKGLIKSIKANSERLGYDWEQKGREAITFVSKDTQKYINSGDGDFIKQIEFRKGKSEDCFVNKHHLCKNEHCVCNCHQNQSGESEV